MVNDYYEAESEPLFIYDNKLSNIGNISAVLKYSVTQMVQQLNAAENREEKEGMDEREKILANEAKRVRLEQLGIEPEWKVAICEREALELKQKNNTKNKKKTKSKTKPKIKTKTKTKLKASTEQLDTNAHIDNSNNNSINKLSDGTNDSNIKNVCLSSAIGKRKNKTASPSQKKTKRTELSCHSPNAKLYEMFGI